MQAVTRVAVLGAGTMGSRIAAHFANAGIPSLLLDLTSDLAHKGIESAAKQRPGGFFVESAASLVTAGSFDDDLAKIAGCDWVLEAVTENLDLKRELWRKVEKLRAPHAILSTNTSGIPLGNIAEGFSEDFRRQFLGTHFFNPPRYLHLLEIIPGPATDPALLGYVSGFAERRLGKGIVRCKDTPNFIGNRIGVFLLGTLAKLTVEEGFTVEEVDALTGPLLGLPNSATFRLLDIIGLDVATLVGDNLYRAVPKDPWRERFLLPDFHRKILERGWLGEKSGQGYYKRMGPDKQIHALDLKTLEYHPAVKAAFPAVDAVRGVEDIGERLRALIFPAANGDGNRASKFLWRLLRDYFVYSAERAPEISDRIVDIDRAMRWGYAHKLGPFELWDAIGFETVCSRLEDQGGRLPENIVRMRSKGAKSLYEPPGAGVKYFDFRDDAYEAFVEPGIILSRQKRIKTNPGASLVDLDDGALCIEFHSKVNALGEDQFQMVHAGLEELEKNFDVAIIANQGEMFSAGANVSLVLFAAQNQEWEELDQMIHRFQQMNLAIKYSRKPVVAAPFSRALGGGCEVCLHAARMQASAETYMGLVEVGVGVLPAAGGCKEMLARLGDARKAAELIGQAKVSTSAAQARELGFLTERDGISMNPDFLIGDAKDLARSLARDYAPPPRAQIKVGGEAVYALLKLGIWSYHEGGYISDYDAVVLEKLAHVLSGGRVTGEQIVSEQYLLDLEREAFLSLCGNAKTQDRIAHMLKTGRPLRN
jgi:3-hydroxyacyl-CoA dehydrogenase